MDACRASSCCHGVKNAPWTEVPVVPSAKATRAVPVPVPAAVAVPLPARGVPQRRWRSWISSLQRRLMRLSIRWTNEPSPHNITNHSIFNIGFPLTGKFCVLVVQECTSPCECTSRIMFDQVHHLVSNPVISEVCDRRSYRWLWTLNVNY